MNFAINMLLMHRKTVTECGEGEFMCDISRCIPSDKVCDNVVDCGDRTDERNCPSSKFLLLKCMSYYKYLFIII